MLGQRAMPGKFGFVGLAAADVASLQVTAADGTPTTVILDPAPVGTVKAFAPDLADGATVVPLDADGAPIVLVGGSAPTVPQYSGEVTPTTVTDSDGRAVSVDTTVPWRRRP